LKSVQLADLLVHVVDGSNPHFEEQIAAVREVLAAIGATNVPELLLFNKADIPGSLSKDLAAKYEGSVWVSAKTGENLTEVVSAIGDRLRTGDRVATLSFPLERGDLVAAAHREGEVLDSKVEENSVRMDVVLDAVGMARFQEWRV
ncbi:MAG: GTPase HflX, partial [Actinomycetota bacterium]